MRIAVYGATGHVGGHIITELLRRGVRPVLVGRNAAQLRAIAPDDRTEIRVAALDDHAALTAAFTGADTVISSLPAYVTNGAPVLAAALAAGTHYVDLSGEQLWLDRVFNEFADGHRARGVLSGVDSYRDSGLMAVAAAVELAEGTARAGFLAAAKAFDPSAFLDGLAPHGISWRLDEETGR
jgi:hypothetical protein